MTYTGEAYKAPSGQWSWRVSDNEGELCGGAGYDDQESAEADMLDQLAQHQGDNQ